MFGNVNERRKGGYLRRVFAGALALVIAGGIAAGCGQQEPGKSSAGAANSAAAAGSATVPWDYKVEEAKVGDLIGSDMTISPNNQLLPNDDNYATGDKVWVLSYMTAEMKTAADGQSSVDLSQWAPLKSYRTAEAAQTDLAGLKVQLKTEVDLVGVYKTDYQGKSRYFAVITLPTGNSVKQPIPEERYKSMKDQKTAKVMLEEVHDFGDYDLAMAKFRGWAD
ncbi:hypothetical protein [Paenibacillus sp. YN15]|uniref:hypothetical protein n=1 Tax=Paenibacillus sp. YN15 TaxID=1742774 RepID=UPI000DCF0A03|nr:hypothetical protein [Paenibacillus sp. YN15]RAU96545.1 signal peptide protein [Paenibacillus sp. YN15]